MLTLLRSITLRQMIILQLNMGIILYCNHNIIVLYLIVIMVLKIQLQAYCNCIFF